MLAKLARLNPDTFARSSGVHLFNCRIELGVGNLKTHFACMRRGGINTEIAQGLAPNATVWNDHLHVVVGN